MKPYRLFNPQDLCLSGFNGGNLLFQGPFDTPYFPNGPHYPNETWGYLRDMENDTDCDAAEFVFFSDFSRSKGHIRRVTYNDDLTNWEEEKDIKRKVTESVSFDIDIAWPDYLILFHSDVHTNRDGIQELMLFEYFNDIIEMRVSFDDFDYGYVSYDNEMEVNE